MRTSEAINEITAALVAVQARLVPAPKDSTNPHFKSKYADLTSVWDACRTCLGENHLAVIQAPTFMDGRVVLVTRIIHKSGQWFESELSIKPTQDTAQGIGSCITYARRYALAAMIGIVADEDDDGHTASVKPIAAPTSKGQATSLKPFNAQDPRQVQWLESYLTNKGISRDSFTRIKDNLHGKDISTELQKIIMAIKENKQ